MIPTEKTAGKLDLTISVLVKFNNENKRTTALKFRLLLLIIIKKFY